MKSVALIALLSCFFGSSALADVSNPNPNVTISTIGNDSFVLSNPYMPVPTDFGVRVVDAKGQPIPGLTVQFNVSIFCDLMFDGTCAIELNELAGSFENGSTAEFVLTDDQGIAVASDFIGAGYPGIYDETATLSANFSSKNASVLAGLGDPEATFQIWQDFATSTIAIQPALTGFWYDKYLHSQVFNIEVLANNLVVVVFYTFDPAGNNVWLVGVGSPTNLDGDTGFADIPLYTTSGGKFPPLYDPTAITKTPWGSLRLHFTDCNSGEAIWTVDGGAAQGYTNGQIPIVRITSIPGLECG